MPVIPARFCLPYITIFKNILTIFGLSLAVAINPAMADMGSKYRDQHGRDPSKRSEAPHARALSNARRPIFLAWVRCNYWRKK